MRASLKPKKIYFRRRVKTGSQIPPDRRRYFIIDQADYEKIKPYHWYSNSDGRNYVLGSINGKRQYLHRFLLDFPKHPLQVDHINGDPSDNRRSNLRLVTKQQNFWNSRAKRDGFKGACYDKRHKCWIAHITLRRKFTFLGKFETEKEAGLAYDCAALQLFGRYAKTNFKLARNLILKENEECH